MQCPCNGSDSVSCMTTEGMHWKLEGGADRNIQGWKKGTLPNEDCGNAMIIDHNICLRHMVRLHPYA